MTRRRREQRGQATVELAMLLPLLVLMLLAVVQVALVARDSIAVTHAARAACRAAIVHADGAAAAARNATTLDGSRTTVSVTGGGSPGSPITVTVTYRSPTDVPLVGSLLGDVRLTDSFSGTVE